MLTFTSATQRHQADFLMQPVLIRVIDNLRKQMEASAWTGTYTDYPLWPQGTTEAQKRRVQAISRHLAETEEPPSADLQQELEQLPKPFPGYQLQLSKHNSQATIDVWDLCCQVCFDNYQPSVPVVVDSNLLDEAGEVNWIALDEKAQQLIAELFLRLEPQSP